MSYRSIRMVREALATHGMRRAVAVARMVGIHKPEDFISLVLRGPVL